MMSPREVYLSRETEFSGSAERLKKLSDRLSMARLAAFAGGLVLFAVLLSFSVIAAVVTLAVALALTGSPLIGVPVTLTWFVREP